jgi:DNA mismatch endonuclease, patch repair protein
MAAIRSADTKPEMLIRRGLHALGFRFRLHDRSLPGRPDMVLAKYRAVIQVQGCYWHGHNCPVGHPPASRLEYWSPKIQGNQERDARNLSQLNQLGWRVMTVWECALRGTGRRPLDANLDQIARWLTSGTDNEELAGLLAPL